MSLPLTTESSTVMSDLNTQTTVHRTGAEPGQFTHKAHAKDGGKASIVPQKLQEKLPESVERAVPNAIHNTDDAGGLHRKQ
ncbi:hypothetical protein IWW34DRAFT_903437 [Fusarium oxysporum f. sp. albedinis]|nr:hypothetical protein IWW34DRAFT_903437 [Fusarium oxysporum f. sp. albedinis]